ncbi:MAG: nicotinate-nucleotide--dimethylbenzimidazole phosphoribosyltransferase [Candidatus Nanopelagicales bacterium]
MRDVDQDARVAATARLDRLTKPPGALGRLEELSVWAAGVQGRCPPSRFAAVHVVVVAGDHGIARNGTSAYPPEVTAQMVANIVAGGAAVNVLAREQGADVTVIDASVDSDYVGLAVPEEVAARRVRRSSGAIDREDALTPDEARAALELGDTVAGEREAAGADLVIVGDMGIGNTTPASALIAALTDGDPVVVTGRGTGIDDATWMRKVTAVRDALWRTRDDHTDAALALQRLGGADLAVMTGLLSGCARRGIPVLLDGVVVTAAALAAERIAPGSVAWWAAGHRSAEPAHAIALAELGLDPVLSLSMRLGEGSGALTALPVLQAAVALLADMATFDSAGVSGAVDVP